MCYGTSPPSAPLRSGDLPFVALALLLWVPPPGYPRLVFLRLGRTSPPKITPGGVTTNI